MLCLFKTSLTAEVHAVSHGSSHADPAIAQFLWVSLQRQSYTDHSSQAWYPGQITLGCVLGGKCAIWNCMQLHLCALFYHFYFCSLSLTKSFTFSREGRGEEGPAHWDAVSHNSVHWSWSSNFINELEAILTILNYCLLLGTLLIVLPTVTTRHF